MKAQVYMRALRSLLCLGLTLGTWQDQRPSAAQVQAPSRVRLVFEPQHADSAGIGPSTLAQLAQVLQRRLDASGVRATAESSGGSIVVTASGVTDLRQLESLLTQRGLFEMQITDGRHRFLEALPQLDRLLGPPRPGSAAASPDGVSQLLGQPSSSTPSGMLSGVLFSGGIAGELLVREDQTSFVDSLLNLPAVSAAVPRGLDLRWAATTESGGGHTYRALYALDSGAILTERAVYRAVAQRDPLSGHSVVWISLTPRGRRLFCAETGRHVHEYMAIVVNGRVQGQPPIITEQICGDAQIDLQNAPLVSAQTLAAIMTGGSLTTPLVLVNERVLGVDRRDWSHVLVLAALAVLGSLLIVLLLWRRREGAAERDSV